MVNSTGRRGVQMKLEANWSRSGIPLPFRVRLHFAGYEEEVDRAR